MTPTYEELLAEVIQLRAKVAAAKPKKATYPPEFVDAYQAMERAGTKWRAGSTPAAAFKCWKARVNAGATPAEILAGTDKYARYCKATGCEVKMAQTFFGPGEHYAADWTIPKAGMGMVRETVEERNARLQAEFLGVPTYDYDLIGLGG